MDVPATPIDEAERLASLRELDILDTPPEERFDRLTRLARRLFDVPIVLISLVDENRQWFKSRVGLEAAETPREVSFCGHAILGDDVFVVADAREDQRFADNPLVTGDPQVRFYAGCPIAVAKHCRIGTLCLIDHEPRELMADDLALLQDLAQMVEQEFIAFKLATMDELTMLSNRRGFNSLAKHSLDLCRRMDKSAALLYFDLDEFKQINDRAGHAEGDIALAKFAELLKISFRESDVIARMGGDEFVVLMIDICADGVATALDRFRKAVDEYNRAALRGYDIKYSVGTVALDLSRHRDLSNLLEEADQAMFQHKKRNDKPVATTASEITPVAG